MPAEEDSRSGFLLKYDLAPGPTAIQTPPQSIIKTVQNLSFNKQGFDMGLKEPVYMKETPIYKEIPAITNPLDRSSLTSGYPVGNSSSLFTDPALLDLVREDMNKIRSRSHINKENLIIN